MLGEERGGTPEERSVEAVGKILGWEIPSPEPERLAGRWAAELDRHGVDRAVIIGSLPGDAASIEAAVACYPKRFYGYFMVNPCLPEARSRVEKALSGGLLQGICFFPAMHGYSIQDERVQPILELASSRPGTVVFVHCGVLTVGVRKKLGLPSYFNLQFSNPASVHAVAASFPKVNFVIPHFGAGYFREALMICDLCPNVYLDTSSSNSWVRYLDADVDLARVFRRALNVAGPQRLLFGTDSSFFPRGWQLPIFQTQMRILSDIGVNGADATAIFGGNLARLLGRK